MKPETWMIDITTCVFCKNGCSYCPQELLKKHYKGTKTLTLKKFKQVLNNIPTTIELLFCGFVEPFQNPECVDMMLYAHKKGYRIRVFTTLIGLSEKDAERIKDIPFTRFFVHQLDTPESMRDFPFVTERMNKDELRPTLTSRAGALYPVAKKPNVVGCWPCSDGMMMPNGDFYPCCMDWALRHKLGNLFETDVIDVLKKKKKIYPLCYYCEYAKI